MPPSLAFTQTTQILMLAQNLLTYWAISPTLSPGVQLGWLGRAMNSGDLPVSAVVRTGITERCCYTLLSVCRESHLCPQACATGRHFIKWRVISSDLCDEDVPRCSCGDGPQLEKLVFVHLDLLTHCKMNHSTAFFHFKHMC